MQTRIDTGGTDACPHFSHDGKTLTYAAARSGGEYDSGANLDLFAHDTSSDDTTGTHDVALTDDPARDDYGNPSPDDKLMVFISDRDGNSELYVMDRDGGNRAPADEHAGRARERPGLVGRCERPPLAPERAS